MTKKSKKEKRRNPNQSHTHTPQGRERERGGELTSTINTKGKERKKEQKGKKKGDYHSQKSQNFHLPPQLRLVFCFLFCFFVLSHSYFQERGQSFLRYTFDKQLLGCCCSAIASFYLSIYSTEPPYPKNGKTDPSFDPKIQEKEGSEAMDNRVVVCLFAFCSGFFVFLFLFLFAPPFVSVW